MPEQAPAPVAGQSAGVVRELIEPGMSRPALELLLCRRGANRLPEPKVIATQVKSFKAFEPR